MVEQRTTIKIDAITMSMEEISVIFCQAYTFILKQKSNGLQRGTKSQTSHRENKGAKADIDYQEKSYMSFKASFSCTLEAIEIY